MSENFKRVLVAFAGAKSARDYRAAKRLAGGLDVTSQFAVIDNIIACRRRLEGMGVRCG